MAQYKVNVKNEILAGLTTALALVPEVVAFALLAHISPLVGIGSAFVICLVTSIFGGRPGMISGAAGSVAVVIVSLVVQHGPEYLFAAVVLMGLLQMAIGLLRLGKFIRLVPQPVVFGFVNGLALIIFMAQLEQFKVRDAVTGTEHWLTGLALAVLLGVVVSALAFAWENAKRIRARKYLDAAGVKHYEIYGPLFFGSVQAFTEKFDPAADPAEVVIDFQGSRVADMSGIDALHKLTERYQRLGKTLHLRHLSPDCRQLLHNAGALIEVNILEDPVYRVATEAKGSGISFSLCWRGTRQGGAAAVQTIQTIWSRIAALGRSTS
ncbi:STAS domain-containing protein [Hymenobacter gummosus]|uniref:STAS domain-containing protein n=1 Tax=Hymenobacter gummosus TaxID=1776032 RepID=A0A431TXZ4_9BACT|nr:SulP family inorganic anion transporter [Hymenobacter gummosus]RTQ46862.1 STAS domain-containing protein [Hymenobacter gummosus]